MESNIQVATSYWSTDRGMFALRNMILQGMHMRSFMGSTLTTIYNIVCYYMQSRPSTVNENVFTSTRPTSDQCLQVLETYTSYFHHRDQHPSEDSWHFLADALHFCDGLTEQLDDQFFNKAANIRELQEEIEYIVVTSSVFQPPTTSDICGLIAAKYWVHPVSISELGIPVLPSSTHTMETLSEMPGLFHSVDNNGCKVWYKAVPPRMIGTDHF